MSKIYFCGSIRGGTQDVQLYHKIIFHLKNHGTVLTEHVGDENYLNKEKHQTDRDIWVQDMGWLHSCDIVVAECTQTSLGVGYELGIAEKIGKPCLVLHRLPDLKLSAMLTGNPYFSVHSYQNVEETYPLIDQFMAQHKTSE